MCGMRRLSVNGRRRCVLELRLRRSVKPRYEPQGLCSRRQGEAQVGGSGTINVRERMSRHRYEALSPFFRECRAWHRYEAWGHVQGGGLGQHRCEALILPVSEETR